MSGDAVLRVVIAEDQRVVRYGLVMLVGLCQGIEVVGAASDGAAVALVDELAPDVVLMDLRIPGMDGVAATREIAGRSAARVVVLTTYAHDESVFPALRAGAAGYLTKDASAEQIEPPSGWSTAGKPGWIPPCRLASSAPWTTAYPVKPVTPHVHPPSCPTA